MNQQELCDHLEGLPIPAIRWLDVTGSTNADAIEWALAGAEDGSLVVADRQTAGRGRLGRSWVTIPGAALAFSLVLRPTADEKSHLSLFSPLGALAVASALTELGLDPEIKWPNDVLLGRRKACGILAESVWTGQILDALVLGVGVNVAPSSLPSADAVLFPAACVEEGLNFRIDRLDLLRAILTQIFAWRAAIDDPKFLDAWQERLAFKGEKVYISRSGKCPLEGRLVGIDVDGNLRLVSPAGEDLTIQVGDVQLRPHI